MVNPRQTNPSISAVVPVLAEEDTVGQVVRELQRSLASALVETLVVTSPKSPAGTLRACRELEEADPERVVVCVQQQWPGVGYAYREGIAAAKGEFILCIDSDGEMDAAAAAALVAEQRSTGADLVVASRWAKRGGLVGYHPLKYALNWGYQQIFRVIFGTRLTDLTHGYKLIRASLARRMPLQARAQDIGCATTLWAVHAGARAAEAPTVWRARQAGASAGSWRGNLRYVAAAWRILRAPRELPPDPGPTAPNRIDWAAVGLEGART